MDCVCEFALSPSVPFGDISPVPGERSTEAESEVWCTLRADGLYKRRPFLTYGSRLAPSHSHHPPSSLQRENSVQDTTTHNSRK